MQNLAPVLPGETLGAKYRVERVLGQGGMGIVVAARHIDLDERVAIKFLLGEPSTRAADRFLREARAAAKVKGEHVCRVFDFGRLDSGEPYIVMEYLDGTDLGSVLAREGAQPPSRVVRWIVEVCAALADAHALGIVHRDMKPADAHALGIVHRDMKPANVLLATRPDGSTCAKVLDFGISKLPQAETITNPEQLMGSPLYMSPEQMQSARDVDARSDIWSLGVMMYKLLTGEAPFGGESMLELAMQVREQEPTAIEQLQPDVPLALRRVIAKCLAKKRDDRYASVAELVADLTPIAPSDVTALAARVTAARAVEATIPLEAIVASAPSPRSETISPMQTTLGGDVAARTKSSLHVRGWATALLVAGGIAATTMALRPRPMTPAVGGAVATAPVTTPSTLPVGAGMSIIENATTLAIADAGVQRQQEARRPVVPKPPASAAILPAAMAQPASSGPLEPPPPRKREIDRDDP